MPMLTVLQGPDKGRTYQTPVDEPTLLGRTSTVVPLTDYTVSRRHAEIKPVAGGWILEDLKSANGTYLNGKRIERPIRLKHGDQIRTGGTLFVWGGRDERGLQAGRGVLSVVSDVIDLDIGGNRVDASITSSVPTMDDSMILASPAAAEAVRAWRVLSSLLETVGAVPTAQELLEHVMDILFHEVPADHGFILMRGIGDAGLEPTVIRHKTAEEGPIQTSKTIIEHVLQHREGVLSSNAMSDERFSGQRRSGSIQAMGLQSVICVPIVSRDDVLGIIHLDSAMSTHIYSEDQLRLVTAIGRMAGMAVENARLVADRMRTERLAATGETVASLSHHIKNIVQGMMSGSDVVEMGVQKQSIATIDQGWQIVKRNLDKIMSLTMNMLAYAKEREPKLETVPFGTVVADCIELVQRKADDKGVLLIGEVEDSLPAIPLDVDGIHQVILNIVTNAIDAAPKTTGVVTVKASFDVQKMQVVLTVGDNGPGIPEEARDRVFDAFFSTKGHGGTGLGLAVSKKIIEEHYGTIQLNSITGEGTLIRITLPAMQASGVDSAATHGPGTH